jgi:phosphatidylserine/phosphatidylglycerophosphate/cardiolipin synthase-like enzyme
LNPRSRFGETTFDNCVTFIIDGEENFRLKYQKMNEAKSSIYIANYDLDPNLQLIRRDTILRSLQIHGLIASSCGSESLESNIDSSTSDTSDYDSLHHGDDEKDYTLQNLLIQKAKQKVDIKIIVWEPRAIVRKLPNSRKRGIEERHKKIEVIREAAKRFGVEDHITIRLDSKAPTLTSGFHEKIMIIDNQIAFCGGQDLSLGKWDTSDHEFDNPLRDPGGEPWHDIHAMVKGPIVWDLIYHFNQRWVYSIWKDIRQVKEIVRPGSIGSYLSSRSPSAVLSFTGDGDTEITALRTWKQLSESKNDDQDLDYDRSQGSDSIRAWYDTMFSKAKDSIYIEDQFLFQDKAITQILVNRLKEQKDLKIITVGPMEPNLPGFVFSIISKESINHVNSNLSALRKAGQNRVRTYSLISQHNMFKDRRKQIYIHSKLMIVDDKWITIGSANTDRDGLEYSTEFDLGIVSTELSRRLRVKLWHEHLRTNDMDSSIHGNLYNFEEGFKAWEELAEENGKRVRRHESIHGHVYYYNFEEMNYPSPYPKANGGNKFRFI